MSIITLFTKTAPTIAGFEFDATLEDVFESSIDFTQYPIESGASAVDHGIIQPFQWRLTGAVSNNPLRPVLTDFTGALSELINDSSGAFASIAGLSAGFLSGSNDTRASQTLQFLIALQASRVPFDIDAGDIQLINMVIANLNRVKDSSTEGGLIFEAQLQELPTLDTLLDPERRPTQNQLREGDPAKNQIAAIIDKGEQTLRDIGATINNRVDEILGL